MTRPRCGPVHGERLRVARVDDGSMSTPSFRAVASSWRRDVSGRDGVSGARGSAASRCRVTHASAARLGPLIELKCCFVEANRSGFAAMAGVDAPECGLRIRSTRPDAAARPKRAVRFLQHTWFDERPELERRRVWTSAALSSELAKLAETLSRPEHRVRQRARRRSIARHRAVIDACTAPSAMCTARHRGRRSRIPVVPALLARQPGRLPLARRT